MQWEGMEDRENATQMKKKSEALSNQKLHEGL